MSDRILHFNGIHGSTGQYLLPPMPVEHFAHRIQGREIQPKLSGKGVVAGIDGTNPVEAGWGILVPQGLDPAIREALGELANHRANPHFDWFTYLPGESLASFQARHGAAPGPVKPQKIPYYLLLVGSPEQIPFSFQESLDVQYAVGRLDLPDADAYARYVRSVIEAEQGGLRSRRAVFFGVRNPDDPSTESSSRCLVRPLAERCAALDSNWRVVHHSGPTATKAALYEELHGDERPALVFTAGHAVFFLPEQVELQRERQGALLMSDWPGPVQWQGPVTREQYFAAHDLESRAPIHGLIAFHFACFSGGTPHLDSFTENGTAPVIASKPFVARLPQALLEHRAGGALAVIAHVDRAWETSFLWQDDEPQVAVFESALRALLEGEPVGRAMEVFGQRYAELAVQLHTQRLTLDAKSQHSAADEFAARLWTAFHDARGYTLLGDPAVRLSLEDEPCPAPDSTPC